MKSKNVLLGMAGVAMFSSGAMAQKPANIILINLDDSGNGDFYRLDGCQWDVDE